jgi:23S rRNA (uracil1939-C5)-methyltransferase
MNMQKVLIDRLGAQGDGIANGDRGSVYVPFTLPGETVTIDRQKDRGRLTAIDRPSAARIEPPCPYFGPEGKSCGGCALQHMRSLDYEGWKRQIVIDALAARGINAEVGTLVSCRPGSRRRAVFSARKTQQGLLFGFNQAGTNMIVPIDKCLLISPAIESQLGMLRSLADLLTTDTKPFRMSVLDTATGLDVMVQQKRLSEKQRQAATRMALQIGLARLSLVDEILIEAHKPVLDLSGVSVSPPPGAFVQASQEAQTVMTELVAQHLAGCKKSADLFSGCGAFALRLAAASSVHAVESDAGAVAALDRAARHHKGLKPVTVERRDLYRRPMQPAELKGFAGAVFDPPRAGAEAQSAELAKSGIGKIAAVSCNPATLARDLRTLLDGGFRIKSITPIDQFLWSAHVEAVALLER